MWDRPECGPLFGSEGFGVGLQQGSERLGRSKLGRCVRACVCEGVGSHGLENRIYDENAFAAGVVRGTEYRHLSIWYGIYISCLLASQHSQ